MPFIDRNSHELSFVNSPSPSRGIPCGGESSDAYLPPSPSQATESFIHSQETGSTRQQLLQSPTKPDALFDEEPVPPIPTRMPQDVPLSLLPHTSTPSLQSSQPITDLHTSPNTPLTALSLSPGSTIKELPLQPSHSSPPHPQCPPADPCTPSPLISSQFSPQQPFPPLLSGITTQDDRLSLSPDSPTDLNDPPSPTSGQPSNHHPGLLVDLRAKLDHLCQCVQEDTHSPRAHQPSADPAQDLPLSSSTSTDSETLSAGNTLESLIAVRGPTLSVTSVDVGDPSLTGDSCTVVEVAPSLPVTKQLRKGRFSNTNSTAAALAAISPFLRRVRQAHHGGGRIITPTPTADR